MLSSAYVNNDTTSV